jgi:hypothetical protein
MKKVHRLRALVGRGLYISTYVFAAVLTLILFPLMSAQSQVLPAPGAANYEAPVRFVTYSVSYPAITTAAALTDFMTLKGSATKTIYLRRVNCSGVSTAAASGTIALVKRSTADTAGTVITPSATAGGQLVAMDAGDVAATAVAAAYSANPTTGTLVGIVRSGILGTSVAAGAAVAELNWEFARDNAKSVVLRGAAQQLALSGLGTALAAGSILSCTIVWIEQ